MAQDFDGTTYSQNSVVADCARANSKWKNLGNPLSILVSQWRRSTQNKEGNCSIFVAKTLNLKKKVWIKLNAGKLDLVSEEIKLESEKQLVFCFISTPLLSSIL